LFYCLLLSCFINAFILGIFISAVGLLGIKLFGSFCFGGLEEIKGRGKFGDGTVSLVIEK
jgi:hypothetical protein